VLIVRQYAYGGLELVVIPQPDGSVACIPAWMTHESASHHQLRTEPRLSLDVLRSVCAEIGALLGFLQSDSRNLFEQEEPCALPSRFRLNACALGLHSSLSPFLRKINAARAALAVVQSESNAISETAH
jgi:hypothetical protein